MDVRLVFDLHPTSHFLSLTSRQWQEYEPATLSFIISAFYFLSYLLLTWLLLSNVVVSVLLDRFISAGMAHEAEAAEDAAAAELDAQHDTLKAQEAGAGGQQYDARQMQEAMQQALASSGQVSSPPSPAGPLRPSSDVSPSEVFQTSDMAWGSLSDDENDDDGDVAAAEEAIEAEQARFRSQNAVISKQLDAAALAMTAIAKKLVEQGKMPSAALAAVDAALSLAQGGGASGAPSASTKRVRIVELIPSPTVTPRGEHAARAAAEAGAELEGASLEEVTPELEETMTLQREM